MFATILLPLLAQSGFNISNTLGDGMVLQRGPQQAVIYGLGDTPGETLTVTFKGSLLKTTVGNDGIWRLSLPAQPASKTPQDITVKSSQGAEHDLKGVLFGDVYLCSGQSNMQYTPHSMAGMNNLTAELAAADAYGADIKFFTVGMQTVCGDPKKNQTDCSKPFTELNSAFDAPPAACRQGSSCRENWSPASSASLGGQAWNTFSAVCWLTGRDIYNALGGEVPLGLISSNWGGTQVQLWQPNTGSLYNSMIAPFTVGPMALTGATWYQGESNVGAASYYAVGFPAMIEGWRQTFKNAKLWFGFVQIASFGYSHPYGNPPRPETAHSRAAGDLRQAQLAALALDNVGMTTAVDTGDWSNIHPPDKQNPSSRLANQALTQIYGKTIPGSDFPFYSGSKMTQSGSTVTVTVAITAGGKPTTLTTDAPTAATQSTTLGKGVDVPRNKCVTVGIKNTYPQDCGYPLILGTAGNATVIELTAVATIGADASSIVLTVSNTPANFKPIASSYGRASWPMTIFFSKEGDKLPVIPWFSNFTSTSPWEPPHGLLAADLETPILQDFKFE